jgi:hypothetical protein
VIVTKIMTSDMFDHLSLTTIIISDSSLTILYLNLPTLSALECLVS